MKAVFLFLLLFVITKGKAQTYDNDYLVDLIQSQRYKEAVSYLQNFQNDQQDFKMIARLAYCSLMAGNLAEAERNYSFLLSKDSLNRSYLLNLASINDKRGNYQKAKSYYQKILATDSTNFSVYKQMAYLAERTNENDLRLNYLKKANSIFPKEPDVAFDLAIHYKKNKELNKADSVIQAALDADSLNLVLIRGKMEIAHDLKNHAVAYLMSKKAIQLGEGSAQTVNILGQSCYYLKKYEECIEVYHFLHDQDLGNQTTFYYTALAYKKLNKPDKCIEFLNKSVEDCISPNITFYLDELALNQEALKNYKESISCYERAFTFKAKNQYNYSIARLYDGFLKNRTIALKYYKRYLAYYKPDKNQKVIFDYAVKRVKELSK